MTLDGILGQERAVDLLRRSIAGGRLAHAYVFTGPPGGGKRATALALATACLCSAKPGEGCGSCPECRLVEATSHPDLFLEDLARAQAERATASQVSIEQVRRVRGHLAMRPVRGSRKIAIVDDAERMTADAQNAMLKTLEEPPGRATLVLVATNAAALLPTIRSRCQQVRFAPLEEEAIERLLVAGGTDPADARTAAPLAEGSLARARDLASGELAERCRDLRDRLDRLHATPVAEVLDLASEMTGSRGARAEQSALVATVLDWCRGRVREAVAASAGEGAGAREAVRHAVRQLERAYATSRDLDRHANAHLSWDVLLLDLRRAGPIA
ncbi:MAG: DNA polymerase III subunit delta' [Alphaproteobacteria bacterium]